MLNKELTLNVLKAPVLEIRFAKANRCTVSYLDNNGSWQYASARNGLVYTVLISNITSHGEIIIKHYGYEFITQNLSFSKHGNDDRDFYTIQDRNKNALIKFE